MAESRIPVGITGEYLDTEEIIQDDTGLPAHREAVFLADPTDPSGKAKITNASASGYGLVTRPILPTDAFGRVRISPPETLFDSKQIHSNQPLFWDDEETSGGSTTSTWSQATASTVIGVGAVAGTRIRQTFRRFNYQPGKSQLFFMTGTLGETGGGAGIKRCMGCYDDNNGIFARDNEGVVEFVIRSSTSGSPVETAASQADWNLDKLDGTGASGITLEPTKSQILVVDFEWLGVGRVHLGFVVGGDIIYCHQFKHANVFAGVYMSTPNLPLRYEIINDGTGGASSLEHICSTVISEGGSQDIGINRCDSNGILEVVAATAGVKYALCGLRLKTANIDGIVKLLNKSVIETNAVDYEWQLIFNPTIAGVAPTFIDETDSVVQFAVGVAANTVTGGTVILAGYVKGGKDVGTSDKALDTSQSLGSAINGVRDEVWLIARPLGANADFLGSIAWRETS